MVTATMSTSLESASKRESLEGKNCLSRQGSAWGAELEFVAFRGCFDSRSAAGPDAAESGVKRYNPGEMAAEARCSGAVLLNVYGGVEK
jgi:hypothetical protein